MKITGLQKLTLIDYPSTIACTVFLAGCNFRCPWCYSKELVLPELIKEQPEIQESAFFDFLKKRQGKLEGVVLCGGEPTLNQDLPQFAEKIKALGYKVKLDTNGSNPAMLKHLIQADLVDYVAMDAKLPKEQYPDLFFDKNLSVDDIDRSINILKQTSESHSEAPAEAMPALPRPASPCLAGRRAAGGRQAGGRQESRGTDTRPGLDYEFRTTYVPTIHNKQVIIKIAQWLRPAKRYVLQPFRPQKTINPKLENLPEPDREELDQAVQAVRPWFQICKVR